MTEKLGWTTEPATSAASPLESGAGDLSHWWQQARQGAQKLARRTRDAAGTSGEKLTSTIRRYPVPSLVAGFTIGGLLGLMLSRRNRASA